MSSVFRKDDNYVDKPKRNVFDLSCQNNLTLKMGKIVPVLCQEVLPGDSFKIDPSFGLRFMPQVFPVQTRQRASIKYYYVRNRNLWKDWMDFIGKTKSGLTPPYIEFNDAACSLLRPSSLSDYLGLPIRVTAPYGSTATKKLRKPLYGGNAYTYVPNGHLLSNIGNSPFSILSKRNLSRKLYVPATIPTGLSNNFVLTSIYGGVQGVSDDILGLPQASSLTSSAFAAPAFTDSGIYFYMFRHAFVPTLPMSISVSATTNNPYLIVRTKEYGDVAYKLSRSNSFSSFEIDVNIPDESSSNGFVKKTATIESVVGYMSTGSFVISTQTINVDVASQNDLCWCDVDSSQVPYYSSSNTDGVRINAMPWRAIRTIYNALIRNVENNPYLIDGVPEYNKYLSNVDGGADTDYTLLQDYLTNWSDDRFTTALPSPQQGNAPLVGLTGVNGATLTMSDEDGTYNLNLEVDSDTGNVIAVRAGANSSDSLVDALNSAVNYGITINDLRNVNSFQRWLENNIRRGYKYKDQLMSHYGVKARYDVLDMPEFIGGVSRDVNVSQITSTTQNSEVDLGEYAGQSSVFGEGRSIEHYCDEHGYIIGLLEVKPMPLYQDCLPKHLIKSDAFDYYFPEFGKIGMQPITKQEIAFSLSSLDGTMSNTFGYQRAWYDYLENLDEVHGGYRFEMRNFLLSRDFANTPSLNPSFLTVDSDDINNTFYSDDDNDKILGQIYHKISAKRPIPMVGIPALE